MPDPVAASPAAAEPVAPAATLATGDTPAAPAAAPAAADPATPEAAAKAEAERVAALSPEAKDEEESDAKAKADADAKAKEEAEAKAKADAVPEKYDLKVPDGLTLDAEVTGEFEAAAKEMGLSQAKAQKLYDIGVKSVQKNTTALLANVKGMQDGWLEASKTDKEFGGADLAKNMAVAKSAMQFATPGLKQILNESRLGDHPEVIRWMFRVGKAMAEDTFVTGQRPISRDETEVARAKRLYPNQN